MQLSQKCVMSLFKGVNMRKGTKHSEETRSKMRENHKDTSGVNNPCYRGGWPHCIICGKELKNRYAKKCQKCAFQKLKIAFLRLRFENNY